MREDIIEMQRRICEKYGSPWVEVIDDLKVGISRDVRKGLMPVNGLRHPIKGDTTGWYIWTGEELSTDPDFFVPLHVKHLEEWCPIVLKFLGLAPGWRFLVTGDYEDVWQDPSLLNV